MNSIRNPKWLSPQRTLTIVGLTFITFLAYSNCAKLQYDDNVNSSAAVSKSSEMIDVAGACASNRSPIGLNTSQEVQCAPLQTFTNADVCPKDYYMYSRSESDRKVTCLKVWELDRQGSLCPVNNYLIGYMPTGEIVCDVMPGVPPDQLCEAGYYFRGLQGNTALCDPLPNGVGTVPNQCPQGKYLQSLENGVLKCVDFDWLNFSQAQCENGKALVGIASGQYVCQSIMNQKTSPQMICPEAKMALQVAAGQSGASSQLECRSDMQLDFVRFCGSGYYLHRITELGFDCAPLPEVDSKYNGTCAAGQYLSGFQNSAPVCVQRSLQGNLPAFCPNGSYPVGISNGQLVCRQHAWLRESRRSCTPYDSEVCSTQNGIGFRACYSDGSAWSECVPSICNAGFELVNSQCKAVSCAPGTSTVCLVPQGSGTRNCRADGKGYETTCNVQSCNSPYRLENNECVTDVCRPGGEYSCRNNSGTFGTKTCNASGSGYGSCVINGCMTGWTLENNDCLDRLAPRIYFHEAPPAVSTGATSSFEIEVVENESGLEFVECRIDGSSWSVCQFPVKLVNLPKGSHRFEMRAQDRHGNLSTKSHDWVLQ